MTTIEITEFDSPLGDVRIATSAGRLCAMGFAEHWDRLQARLQQRFGRGTAAAAQPATPLVGRLQAYFAGDLSALAGVDVDPGGTPFQRRVWDALLHIPAGQTTSYSAIASAIGAPRAVRAVGAANGANPIWLVIPCHRAIGADGRLVGYAGGIERKRWLLQHEGALVRRGAPVARP
ncbi:MAG: methylated-DNA--[protein]-cysteine S-methyltransferase [Candidatus Binatia bacterium]